MKQRRPIDRFRRLRARLREDRGSAMLEFVLVAPILCYLIAAILFFRTQIDYAQDQIIKTRQWTWEKSIPGTATGINNLPSSDDNKFFQVPLYLRPILMINAITGIGSNTGALLAIASYLGNDITNPKPPYEALGLKVKNYIDTYNTPDSVPPEPWSQMMGEYSQWFAAQIGTGNPYVPQGLKSGGWKDRFPMPVEPWMRQYSDALDPFNYAIPIPGISLLKMGYVWNVIDAFNLFRTPLLRYDARDDKDVGEDATDDWPGTFGFRYSISFLLSGDCDQLKLTSVTSSSDIKDIVE